MDIDRLIELIEFRLVADGFTIADSTLDLAQHIPSNPEAAGASSVHPDNELRDLENRHIHRDTIRVLTVTRLGTNHKKQDSWIKEKNIRHTVTGRYENARVFYASSTRGYHPANRGWYLVTQLFNTTRKVINEH